MFYHKATLWQGGSSGGGSISFVGSANNSGEGVASLTLTFNTTPQAGDTVFILVGTGRSSGYGPPIDCTVSGYTRQTSTTRGEYWQGLFWKRLTAADTSATVTSTSSNNSTAAVAYIMRGVNASPFGVPPSITTGSFPSSQIDPPSVTPTIAGSAVLAFGGLAVDTSLVQLTSASSGFSNPVLRSAGGNTPLVRLGMCWKAWTTGAVDPGSFGLNYTNNSLGTISGSAILVP